MISLSAFTIAISSFNKCSIFIWISAFYVIYVSFLLNKVVCPEQNLSETKEMRFGKPDLGNAAKGKIVTYPNWW